MTTFVYMNRVTGEEEDIQEETDDQYESYLKLRELVTNVYDWYFLAKTTL